MQWNDEGIVVSARPHGESSVVLEVLTRAHGRHLGMVRGGRSRAMRPILQPGNRVGLVWRARLDEHLGNFAVEGLTLEAARLMADRAALFGLGYLAALVRLLPERDPHESLYETLGLVLEHLDDPETGPGLVVRFELAMLAELGFGLDLSACAATGTREDLAWVSPRTGRAVSAAAGQPYADRLLRLPAFLTGGGTVENAALLDGFRLTGFFLMRDVFDPRGGGEPAARRAYVEEAARRHPAR
jgi:DNA repair protein RecO (recombination protein O)